MAEGGKKKSHDENPPALTPHSSTMPSASTFNFEFALPQSSNAADFAGPPSAPIFPFDDPAPAPVAQTAPSLDELLSELPFTDIEFSTDSDVLAVQTKSPRSRRSRKTSPEQLKWQTKPTPDKMGSRAQGWLGAQEGKMRKDSTAYDVYRHPVPVRRLVMDRSYYGQPMRMGVTPSRGADLSAMYPNGKREAHRRPWAVPPGLARLASDQAQDKGEPSVPPQQYHGKTEHRPSITSHQNEEGTRHHRDFLREIKRILPFYHQVEDVDRTLMGKRAFARQEWWAGASFVVREEVEEELGATQHHVSYDQGAINDPAFIRPQPQTKSAPGIDSPAHSTSDPTHSSSISSATSTSQPLITAYFRPAKSKTCTKPAPQP